MYILIFYLINNNNYQIKIRKTNVIKIITRIRMAWKWHGNGNGNKYYLQENDLFMRLSYFYFREFF